MLGRLRRAWSGLISGYWFIPTAVVVAALVGALGLLSLDVQLESDGRQVGFTGGPDSARALLSSIASSMLTLTAPVFSVTVVVLQLASGPRRIPLPCRDRQKADALAGQLPVEPADHLQVPVDDRRTEFGLASPTPSEAGYVPVHLHRAPTLRRQIGLCGGVPGVTPATLPLGNQCVKFGPRQGDGLVGGRSAGFAVVVTAQALPELARCLAHAACQLGELLRTEEQQDDNQDDEEFDRPDGLHNPEVRRTGARAQSSWSRSTS